MQKDVNLFTGLERISIPEGFFGKENQSVCVLKMLSACFLHNIQSINEGENSPVWDCGRRPPLLAVKMGEGSSAIP